MSFGFGVVGCGTISNFHAKAIASMENASVVGCYSRTANSSKAFAKSHRCEAYESLEQMLADEAIDIVSICTPSGAHMEPAIAAAKAGKHVVIEKPLEINLQRCDAIIKACADSGVVLSTIFQSRFHQAPQLLKKAIEQGRFGKLVLANAYVKWNRTQEYYDSGAWRGTWDLDGGGALMNQAIHSVDLLSWLMGPVKEICAMTATLTHERIEVEDTAVANLRFESGALGTIEATTSTFPGCLKKIEIRGSAGSAIIEEEDIKKWEFAEPEANDAKVIETFAAKTQSGGGAADPTAISFEAHAKQFADIIKAIETGSAPAIDGAEARKSVEIITGIYKAAKTGSTTTLPQ